MKIRSLMLGSVAAAGLSTGAFAADLGVLTSLDVCDDLGISGLTISSDTNCLAITGEVKYTFEYGDFRPAVVLGFTEAGTADHIGGDGALDWTSKLESWIQFVATAGSDFGPAKAVIKIKDVQHVTGNGDGPGGIWGTVTTGGSDTGGPIFDEAYVAIGDSTVIIAGKASSLMNKDDDEPLNWLGLFNSQDVDTGVDWDVDIPDGGHVLQITHDLGNGLSIGAGLENLAEPANTTIAGTVVGVIEYAGDGISAHVTAAAAGFLDGVIENWGVHAGVSGSFDMFKFVVAGAFDSSTYWNVLGSASATFDLFTIAVSGEAAQDSGGGAADFGAGASLQAAVTDGVTLNLGSRWYWDDGAGNAFYQVAAGADFAITETMKLSGQIGMYGNTAGPITTIYGAGELTWTPGGDFTGSLKGEAYASNVQDVGYRATVKAAKKFQ